MLFTERTWETWQQYIADLLLFAPFGIGYAFSYTELMEMDIERIEFFYERKMRLIEVMSRK